MGEVIRFRPREGVRRQNGEPAKADEALRESAQILLFTGVRYERYGEAGIEAANKPQKKRGRPRKRA